MDWEKILSRQQDWTRERADELRLSREEATKIYEDAPLHALMKAANRRRIAMHPEGNVTYLIDRNINYTNVCTI